MDDVILLAPKRWKLRRVVRVVNQVLTGLRLEKAPAKTFIGRVERGFDFLGFRLSPSWRMRRPRRIASGATSASD